MTAAAGFISIAQELLRVNLGDSNQWRAWVKATGTGAAEQAQNKVHDEALPPSINGGKHTAEELRAARPFAIITTRSAGLEATGSPAAFSDYGAAVLKIEDSVPANLAGDDGAVARWFLNRVGVVMEEIAGFRDQAGYLAIDSVELAEWGRSSEAEAVAYGDAVQAIVNVTWSTK